MRKKEHVSCGCTQCTRGKRTKRGHFIITQTNRRLRQKYRTALRNPEAEPITIDTPYTD